MGKLDGKTAIVTGAGRGIGRGIALRLAKDGAHVVVGSRSENTVNQVVGEITATSHSAIGFTVDVGVADQVAAMVDKTLQTFGGVDILVNVAQSWGRPDSKSMSPPETPFEDISDEEWDYTFRSGFKGTLYGMKAVLPFMKGQRNGRIINFGSPVALTGKALMAPYNMTKEAIRSLTLTAAHELAPYEITVNCILPTILTDALADNRNGQLETLMKTLPMGRLGDPEHDAGGLAAFLASDDAAYLTGGTLILDGGAAH
jgi:NAD(P)-dependent dehydrogenase (short-subunit alcohol dehydrogenase family)